MAALLAALVLAVSGGIDSSWDTVAGVSFHPFTTNDENVACVPWSDPSGITTRNCDPVNVVFPDQTLDVVAARLRAAGWTDGSGSDQRLHFGSAMNWPRQDLQLVWVQDATDRFHVRLWQVGPAVVGAVHHDLGATTHVQDLPWDTSEAFLAQPLCSTWCEHVAMPHQLEIQGGPTWRGLPNDAVATVIPLQPPPPPAVPAHRHRHRQPTPSP
jgi:hypothetical protein